MLMSILVLGVLVAGLLAYARSRPDRFQVSRSLRMAARPADIYPYLEDFRRFPAWIPYEHKDPAMERRLSGAPSGPGAIYEFAGDSRVGTGRMEILEAEPHRRVRMSLDMLKPMKAHNIVEFTLRPEGDATLVTWSMEGCNPLVARLLGLFINMDRMIGKDFEQGLASLKAAVEGAATHHHGVPA